MCGAGKMALPDLWRSSVIDGIVKRRDAALEALPELSSASMAVVAEKMCGAGKMALPDLWRSSVIDGIVKRRGATLEVRR
ncbi:hypothetical protein M0R45_016652 [Rubus argutus]|uniref:Uncharacterized protein n=1 Tax=Rubus argutus TaxID=59490 RepID=A0AAW1XVU9_RUBAR